MTRMRNVDPIDVQRQMPEHFLTAENRNKSLENNYTNNTISYNDEYENQFQNQKNQIK